ncbi:hypothetical protein [Variovorax paradoxus]|uniref:Leucine rich repeat variant n=1 Tax=Variovorax paradoxus TaxID=34073 RepID=A0A6I6HK91_VARPD|nr:hypothetical protein [Variovorax paradoxus]QGW83192.1 hypothetical protein GOQ09_17130 [Variovorax paradoxus]
MISSASEFAQLRSSQLKEEYDRAAHEEASLEVWKDVIENYPELRKWVAHNKTVPLEILQELCKFEVEVRFFVASKRKLSQELFELLSVDPDSTVRQQIAANKKTPLDILEKLSTDKDEDVVRVAKFNLLGRK